MQGTTHLAFGATISVTAVALGGLGLASGVTWSHHALAWPHGAILSLPSLHPAAWLALILAGGLGSLLPDIDQPGSLITRMPAREGRAIGRLTQRYGRGTVAAPVRFAGSAAAASGGLASALLGSEPGQGSRGRRMLFWVLACLCAALFAIVRWIPPVQLLAVPVQGRHLLALTLAALTVGSALLALGGVAGLIYRLPGHHRGWTHAPPFALALAVASFALGPLLLPALPGVGAAFAAGYLSHLVADALTIRGIPLCWPGQQAPSLHLLPRPLRVRTGSGGEVLFNVCWVAALPALALALIR
ncbi:MAG TPA: metal-dependent hydrolase [Chloroflexota bacterium]|nr:metal-dependent hydrolase [Chloroflexota bacterium]